LSFIFRGFLIHRISAMHRHGQCHPAMPGERKDAMTLTIPRLLFAITVLLCAAATTAIAADAQRPPNIVFILTDDLGYTDLSCYGAPQIRTPNVDRMAAEGVRFTDFYATACVCTPTRASLMTGCYPKRVGLHVGVLNTKSAKGLNPDEVTIAKLLRGRGYATMCIGKWHLGESPQTLPTNHGFDAYFGMAGPNHGASDLYRDAAVIEQKGKIDLTQLTQRYTKEAIEFIRKSKDKPFFLYLAHGAPHVPLYASAAFKGKSAGGLYGDMIEEIDAGVGEVLGAIKELGLDGQTLVVFTSDNGQYGIAAPPLHGGKGSTWEAGLRVPCIVRWPGVVPAGGIVRDMTIMFDWMPTLAQLGGATLPAGRKIDAVDIWPLVLGRAGTRPPHDHFVYYSREGLASAVRAGRWKLHVIAPVEKWAGKLPRKETLLDTRPTTPPPWLYDLEADPGETHDVAAEHPDLVKRLRESLEATDAMLTREARPVFDPSPGR
jgi:arylsulfatase A-like enzyme